MSETKAKGSADQAPSASFLKRLETASLETICDLLKIPSKPRDQKAATLTPKQDQQLREIEREAITDFKGDLTPTSTEHT